MKLVIRDPETDILTMKEACEKYGTTRRKVEYAILMGKGPRSFLKDNKRLFFREPFEQWHKEQQ